MFSEEGKEGGRLEQAGGHKKKQRGARSIMYAGDMCMRGDNKNTPFDFPSLLLVSFRLPCLRRILKDL